MIWLQLHPDATVEHDLGFIPDFLSEDDPRPARDQIDDNYCSGWKPLKGITISENRMMQFPGDPDLPPLFMSLLNRELIIVYPLAWVAVHQFDGSYEVARLD